MKLLFVVIVSSNTYLFVQRFVHNQVGRREEKKIAQIFTIQTISDLSKFNENNISKPHV